MLNNCIYLCVHVHMHAVTHCACVYNNVCMYICTHAMYVHVNVRMKVADPLLIMSKISKTIICKISGNLSV